MANRQTRRGKLFKKSVAENGMNLADFSRITGVHVTTVSRWANGHLEVPRWAFLTLWLIGFLPEDVHRDMLDGNINTGDEHHGR